MASVADISAASYDLCGVVRMVNSGDRAKVTSNNVWFYFSTALSVSYVSFHVFEF